MALLGTRHALEAVVLRYGRALAFIGAALAV